jgi:hypothetical protein
MDKNYIYIIRRREHVRTDEDIYKIGHTTRGIDRLKEYDNGVGIEVHGMFPVVWSKEAERSVIELFNSKYESARECTGSSESYKGNVEDMVKDIKNVCKGYTKTISIDSTTLSILRDIDTNKKDYESFLPQYECRDLDTVMTDVWDSMLKVMDVDDGTSRDNTSHISEDERDYHLYRFACTYGHLSIAKVVSNRSQFTIDKYIGLFHIACEYDNIDVAKYIFDENLSSGESHKVAVLVCKYGYLSMLKWLHEIGTLEHKYHNEYFRIANDNGNYVIARWIKGLNIKLEMRC